jgi:SAM-dependent methyltransferase
MLARSPQPELMDDPEIDPRVHRQALRGLSRINRLSRTAAILWRAIRAHVPQESAVRLLDLGCGGGDVLIGLARRGAREGIEVHGLGCDVSATAVQHAREAAAQAGGRAGRLEFIQCDCLRDDLPGDFDVAYCSLFVHHLAENDVTRVLRRMRDAACRAVLVDDLRRTRWGYALAWWGTRVLSRSQVVHTDGPLSVAAAFTEDEFRALAERAGLSGARLTRHWPCRFLLEWSRV